MSVIKKIQRILFMPYAFLLWAYDGVSDYSRDIQNRKRFSGNRIGRKCILDDSVQLSVPVKIGYESILLNTVIGKYSYIQEHCVIQNATIGNYCSIAPCVRIGLGRHNIQVRYC